jgi:hypothetical protein
MFIQNPTDLEDGFWWDLMMSWIFARLMKLIAAMLKRLKESLTPPRENEFPEIKDPAPDLAITFQSCEGCW